MNADERIEADDLAAFALPRAQGWQFRRVGVPDLVQIENVRWLSRYRRPRV